MHKFVKSLAYFFEVHKDFQNDVFLNREFQYDWIVQKSIEFHKEVVNVLIEVCIEIWLPLYRFS